jgi:hypothetical protein
MKKRLVVLGILLTIMSVCAIGCYTVLTHPMVQGEETEAIDHTGEYYREHCTDCHGDYHNYPYGFYYGYYPDYYWSSPRWGHYYAYPWWWDRYWWDNGEHGYDETVQPPESSEKADRRRGMVPPYVPPTGNTNTPLVLPNPSTGQQPSENQQPGTIQPTPMPKQDQEKKQSDSDATKAKRRK